LLLAVLVLAAGWAWAPVLSLSFTGEDLTVLARLGRGGAGTPHVFRPWPDLLLRALHAVCGVASPVPYHLAALGLHGANAALVFLLARRICRSSGAGLLAASVFAFDAAGTDALAWIAALNRPVSTLGALLAWNGLVRWGAGGRRGVSAGAAAVVAGLALQYGANEEVYGTALAVVVGLAWIGARERAGRRAAWGLALALVVALAALYPLRTVPGGGTEAVLARGLVQVPGNVLRRGAALASGLGLPSALGFAWPLLGLAALLAPRARAAAGLALAAWVAAFVPFALSDASGYRHYPSLAPAGLLVAAAAHAALTRARRGGGWAWELLALVPLVTSTAPRAARLERWENALREIAAVRPALFELAARQPDEPPVLVNLETTTSAALLYAYPELIERGPAALRTVGFLDAVGGLVPPTPEHLAQLEGAWFGRRCDGSFGPIEPADYLTARPRVPEHVLVGRAIRVAGLDEARAALTRPDVDPSRMAVVQASDEAWSAIERALGEVESPDPPERSGPVGELEVLAPLTADAAGRSATLRVRVRAPAPALLACHDNVLYDPLYRFAPDQVLFSDVEGQRAIGLRALDAASGEELATCSVNAFGLGCLVPAGEHEIELVFSLLSPAELR